MSQPVLWMVFSVLFLVLAITNYATNDMVGFWACLTISTVYNVSSVMHNKIKDK